VIEMNKTITALRRKIKKDRVKTELDKIKQELQVIEKCVDKDDTMSEIEIEIAIDQILISLNRMTECYVKYDDESQDEISLFDYIAIIRRGDK